MKMSSFLGLADVARPLTPTQQVRLELRARNGRYLTHAELMALTGLEKQEVNSAISALTKQGMIRRRVPSAEARRNGQQAYMWNGI